MKRNRVRLTNRNQRPVISDTLPFEVPPSFSNRHFCDFLVRFNIRLEEGSICWEKPDDGLDAIIRLMTGVQPNEAISVEVVNQFGSIKSVRKLKLLSHSLITIPFGFEIAHKATEGRRLTIPHPLNQLAVAEFYNAHASLIMYYAQLSPFSIRKPVRIARYSNFKDRLHESLLAKQSGQIEEKGKEYDQIGSFFVYESYSNVFKFFESYQYHRAEKRFNAMAKVDISKCFDSVYTHSLPWALHGNRPVKDDLVNSKSTFSGRFDALMQNLNQNETNGIIIGPEFCRIFAELILQSVDVALEKRLRDKHNLLHRHDYEIFRYVDDYYIFFNEQQQSDVVIEHLQHLLADVKLHINPSKTKVYDKPIITEITIAKNLISNLIADSITVTPGFKAGAETDESTDIHVKPERYACRLDSRDLIVKYKTVLKSAGVTYLEVGNYTFALLEARVDSMLSNYVRTDPNCRSEDDLVGGIVGLMEFSFFIYASAPRVNLSIRLTRIVTTVTKAMRQMRIASEQKHRFYKYVYDNASHQIKENQASEFKEIETLYLLLALGEIGKEYWLDERIIRQHFHISERSDGSFQARDPLGYFSITVLLTYFKTKKKYDRLRVFVVQQALAKIEGRSHYRYKDAEVLMLSLDLISCPYVDDASKQRIADVYALTSIDLQNIKSSSSCWFTTWSGSHMAEELDAKRRREVY